MLYFQVVNSNWRQDLRTGHANRTVCSFLCYQSIALDRSRNIAFEFSFYKKYWRARCVRFFRMKSETHLDCMNIRFQKDRGNYLFLFVGVCARTRARVCVRARACLNGIHRWLCCANAYEYNVKNIQLSEHTKILAVYMLNGDVPKT